MRAALVLLTGALLAICGGSSGAQSDPVPRPDPGLRDELLAMQRADQQERTGAGLPDGALLPPSQDYFRTQRLKKVIAASGWPTIAAVGTDGASAAWLVAQHADFDPDFQEQVVGLMTPLVASKQADPTDLAYLVDRVAVNRGRPQTYGTQIRCRSGKPAPATAINDPAGVDARRAEVELGTLAQYYAELAPMCAEEAAQGQQPVR
jgi:hypothetical protein